MSAKAEKKAPAKTEPQDKPAFTYEDATEKPDPATVAQVQVVN